MWTFLHGYVTVGHRKMGDQKASPCGHKIPTGSPPKSGDAVIELLVAADDAVGDGEEEAAGGEDDDK